MSLATITFWVERFNSHGIPNTLYTYLVSIFVNQVVGKGDKIVKIVPLSVDAPTPVHERPFIIRNSSTEKAISEAFNILNQIPELQGLRSYKSIIKSEEKSLQFINH